MSRLTAKAQAESATTIRHQRWISPVGEGDNQQAESSARRRDMEGLNEALSVKGLADRIVWTAKKLGELAGKNENQLVRWFSKTVRDSTVRQFISRNVNELLMALQAILQLRSPLYEGHEHVNSVVILDTSGNKLYVIMPSGTKMFDVDMDDDDFLGLFEKYCSNGDVFRPLDKTFACCESIAAKIAEDLA